MAKRAQLERVHLRDFETLGLPSRNCFDLLVKIIVVLWHVISRLFLDHAIGLEFFGVKPRFVVCPIMRCAPCLMR